MAQILKQSTAVDVIVGPFVDSTNGDTEETGLTITQSEVLLSKNGQGLTQKNDNTSLAHDANGMYNCELDATDTDTIGQLTIFIHESGALAVRHDYQIVEQDTYEFLFASGSTPDADVASILADTNELQGDWANAGRLDTIIDSILADTGELQTDWVNGGRLDLLVDAVVADVASLDDTKIPNTLSLANINAEVDTALNTAIPGGPTANSINERVAAIDGKLPSGTISDFDESTDDVTLADGSITAAKYAANAREAAGQATDEVNAIADGTWNEAKSGHTTQGTYGENQSAVISAKAVTGTLSTTQATTNLTNATNDSMNGRTLIWTGNITAALKGQATDITDYVGASKRLTYTALTTAPANNDEFLVV